MRILFGVFLSSVLAVCCAKTAIDSDITTLNSVSFDACRADAECARRFFINTALPLDRLQFNYLFERFCDDIPRHVITLLKDNIATPPLEVQQLSSLSNNTRDALRTLWVQSMARATFCTDNEEWVGDRCRCRDGKVCHEAPPSRYALDRLALNVLLLGVVIALLYYTIRLLRELIALRRTIARQYTK